MMEAQSHFALNQDPAGNQATVTYDSSDLQILVRSLANGDIAVAVFNRGSGACEVTLQAAQLKYRPDQLQIPPSSVEMGR